LPKYNETMKRLHAPLIIMLLLGLQYCGAMKGNRSGGPTSNSSGGNVDTAGAGGNSSVIKMTWQAPNVSSYGNTNYYYQEAAPSQWWQFCFDNNNPQGCAKHTAAVRDRIMNNPTVLQGFELYFAKGGYDEVVLYRAAVQTHLLMFNQWDGKMVLSNKMHMKYYNPAYFPAGSGRPECGDASTLPAPVRNSAGIYNAKFMPRDGEELPITGLYIYDEVQEIVQSQAGGYYNNPYMTGARAWFSGIAPWSDGISIFRYTFVPETQPERIRFGYLDSPETNPNVLKSPYFGLNAANNVPNWGSHIITGICLEGWKKKGNSYRPLIYKMKIKTNKPAMQRG
jgi:hypothetical protein